jgi:hypothetical protein
MQRVQYCHCIGSGWQLVLPLFAVVAIDMLVLGPSRLVQWNEIQPTSKVQIARFFEKSTFHVLEILRQTEVLFKVGTSSYNWSTIGRLARPGRVGSTRL